MTVLPTHIMAFVYTYIEHPPLTPYELLYNLLRSFSCIFCLLLSGSVAFSDFGHIDWSSERDEVDQSSTLQVRVTLVPEHVWV